MFGGALDVTGKADLGGRSILVVEDDYFFATDAARARQGAGATVLVPCPTEADSRGIVKEQRPDAAVLDVNLGVGATCKLAGRQPSPGHMQSPTRLIQPVRR